MSEPFDQGGGVLAGSSSHKTGVWKERRLTAIDTARQVRPPKAALKVLFANKFFYLKGGAEAVMFDEIDLMKKHAVDVVEFSMCDPRNRPSKYGSYFVSLKDYRSTSRVARLRSALSFINSREAADKISSLIRNEKPDIMHCHNVYHQLTPSIINAASRIKIPIVLTLHDYKLVCPVYTRLSNGQVCTKCSDGHYEALLVQRCADGSIGRSVLLWGEARFHAAAGSYQRVDKFIAPSRFMRDAVVPRLGEDKVVYIPNGVDTSRIEVSGQDDGFVLYLGRLSPEKGVETLLRAHAGDNAAWRLVVAGAGPLLGNLQSRFPLAEFTGHLTGEALEARLRDASMVVVPSEWHENNPLSILEAMAHAKPIVASHIGGIPELVSHGKTGLLFEPKNAQQLSSQIKLLLSDSDLRRKFGREARRIAETEYSLERHGAALLSLYQSLAAPSGAVHQLGP
ncbi:glycosyltransferase family 4 protein [Bradyrhizobium lablabi]|uniref:glycosyltransferase family 4 protein n=1 Tax=Bradyrhizobium lablabi TaxID=722472 RepID=UPI001BA4FD37|nr:glycosyltransferase family 4 protein [Bradyrhizobium lablabi]MBR0696599.1 glycosyltransferase family 4 protein [Bradyrhizobium lablabi]